MKMTLLIALLLFPAILSGWPSGHLFNQHKLMDTGAMKMPTPQPAVDVEKISFDKEWVYLGCPERDGVKDKFCPGDTSLIITTTPAGTQETGLIYHYEVTGGIITGSGPSVVWDFTDTKPGDYSVTVSIENRSGVPGKSLTKNISYSSPCCCYRTLPCDCAEISVISPIKNVRTDQEVIFEAQSIGGPYEPSTYNWTVSGGKIMSGQGTAKITVKVTNQPGEHFEATVDIGGLCASCPTEAVLSLPIVE